MKKRKLPRKQKKAFKRFLEKWENKINIPIDKEIIDFHGGILPKDCVANSTGITFENISKAIEVLDKGKEPLEEIYREEIEKFIKDEKLPIKAGTDWRLHKLIMDKKSYYGIQYVGDFPLIERYSVGFQFNE